VKFKCTCLHTFLSSPSSIVAGQWCPYCAKKKVCGRKNCDPCYVRSLASSIGDKHWSADNGDVKPWQISKYSQKKCSIDCSGCNTTYKASAGNISQGTGCPKCINKSEKKLGVYFENSSEEEAIHQPKYEWCKSDYNGRNFKLPFDYSIENYKTIIELDGVQHFKDVKYFKLKAADVQQRDLFKMVRAIQNGYSVIRLLQEDVYFSRNNWEERLKLHLRKHPIPHVILLDSEKGEYTQLRKLLDEAKIVHLSA
jgi:hypothetical protein